MHVAIGNPPMGEPEILIQQSAKAASIEQDPKRLIERFNKLTQALDGIESANISCGFLRNEKPTPQALLVVCDCFSVLTSSQGLTQPNSSAIHWAI